MKILKKRILPFALSAAVMGATMVMGNLVTSAHAMNPCEGLSGCSTSGAFSDEEPRPIVVDNNSRCIKIFEDKCKEQEQCASQGDRKSECEDDCFAKARGECT